MKNYIIKGISFKVVLGFFGRIVFIESLFMISTLIIDLIYKENNFGLLLLSIAPSFFSGIILIYLTKDFKSQQMIRKESFLIVSLTWVIVSLFGSLPFLLLKYMNFTDAFFETVSGFTTTGASILSDIERLPHSLLWWRSLTHWMGGIGIIVMVIAIFPYLKTSRLNLFSAEASVIVEDKPFPRILIITRWIWGIYISLTLIETILLMLGGMNLFESLCHSFGTVATGGFSTRNSSIADFSPYIQYVIAIFMILSGVNFTLYIFMIQKNFKKIKNEELIAFLLIVGVSVVVVTLILIFSSNFKNFEEAFRVALFQIVSMITTTGFVTYDFTLWPHPAIAVIILIMFVGASAGSTSGNIKVARILLFFKNVFSYFRKLLHPEAISYVKYNGKIVSADINNAILVFIFTYVFIVFFGSFIVSLSGVDLISSFGAVATTMGGIGPGLGVCGPVGNFSSFPVFSKYFLSLIMIIGRLEIFTFLVIFTRNFWK